MIIPGPLNNFAFLGNPTDRDLEHQMIVYADQSTYRTALLMKVAEEQHLYKNRKVVYLSESPYSRHLMKLGFLNYQPEDSYLKNWKGKGWISTISQF